MNNRRWRNEWDELWRDDYWDVDASKAKNSPERYEDLNEEQNYEMNKKIKEKKEEIRRMN